MKRVIGLMALAMIATTGCELFGSAVKKEEKKEDKPAAAPAAPQIDYRDYVTVPGQLTIGEGAKVGYAVVAESDAAGTKSQVMTAIVNETDEVWHIETTQTVSAMPQLKGYLIGMVVNKADGKVTKAFCGKPGEDVKDIKISPYQEPPKTPEGTDTEVTLTTAIGGPHKAKMVEISGNKSYSGLEGELKGVPLKYEAAQGAYELEKVEAAKMDVGGTEIDIKKIILTSGTQFWVTENPVISAMSPYGANNWGRAALASKGYSLTIVKMSDAHKKELKWE